MAKYIVSRTSIEVVEIEAVSAEQAEYIAQNHAEPKDFREVAYGWTARLKGTESDEG